MRLGSFDWAEATAGKLTAADRRSFIGPALRQSLRYTAGRLRLGLGLRGNGNPGFDPAAVELPDSKLARDAEAEAQATITPSMINHSYRTFVYGLAIANLDGVKVDHEHLYATSLLHDIAVESPDPQGCFAVRGARKMREIALRAGVDEPTARDLATAIVHHITPGAGDEFGPLPLLIQQGAMVDLTGERLWDLRPDFVDSVLSRYPRLGMKKHLSSCWKAETRAFPEGRAAFIEKAFLFSLLVRLSPFRE